MEDSTLKTEQWHRLSKHKIRKDYINNAKNEQKKVKAKMEGTSL